MEAKKQQQKEKMSWEMKFEVEERKYIKPSTATPPHLKTFKLSLIDQLSPTIHINIILFYPHNTLHFSTKSQLLQTSLSQTLTRFYPVAGRLQDAATVHCNDDGVLFIESQTNASLSDILTAPNFDTLQGFLPSADDQNASMLLVRFTSFRCGATAVTISLSHKIADMATVLALLQTWTAACAGAAAPPVPELGAGVALFPPREIPDVSISVKTVASEKLTWRRFVFDASKVRELKEKVKSALENGEDKGSVFEPSRVEVVLALIWKCALAASRSKTVSFKRSVMFQAVNLRPRMEPAVSDAAVGNILWMLAVTVEEERHVELHALVRRIREGMREFVETKVEKFKEDGAFGVLMESLKEMGEVFRKSKDEDATFPLLNVDFGWGEPLWMCSVNKTVNNTITLTDTRDGGVEAFVILDDSEMFFFEQDPDLLHYALLNPSLMPSSSQSII
ncbi:Vinorine synthase, partial [Mucuna pruriens]